MNTQGWKEYLKHDQGDLVPPNLVYAPLVSPDGTVYCMDYGNDRIKIDNTFYFDREIDYITRFSGYAWMPENINIDRANKKIFFKWYGHTCNDLVHQGTAVDNSQLKQCVLDILSAGVYKLNVYPHCFYFDNVGKIHAMDFYACIDRSEPYLPVEQVRNVMGQDNLDRWHQAIEGDRVNFEKFFHQGILKHIHWPGDPLKDIINAID